VNLSKRYELKDVITLQKLNEDLPIINWNIYFDKRFEFYGLENPLNRNSSFMENIHVYYSFIKNVDVNDLINYAEW